MIRITAGKFKNRSLETISKFVRPTSSLKREAFFSILDSHGIKNSKNLYQNKIFLDLFAGIGTMGLESISRGVEMAVFFENNTEVLKVLKKNLSKLCKNNQYKIFKEDIQNSNLDIDFNNISIVYVDPPYLKYNINKLLILLQNKISKNCIIGIETSTNDNFIIPNKLNLINKKIYGKTKISFLVLS